MQAATVLNRNKLYEKFKKWKIRSYPPTPTTTAEFAKQLEEGKYDHILSYEEEWRVEAVPIVDKNNDIHIIFYDAAFDKDNFEDVETCFVDATFKSRPNLKDCRQLLTFLGVLANRVSKLS